MRHYQHSDYISQQLPDYYFNHNTDMKTIAERLIEERALKGWSQGKLASEAKIAQSFIGALEAKGQKSSGWLPEIANALGVDAYWLKTGMGDKHGKNLKLDPEQSLILRAFALMSDESRDDWLDKAHKTIKKTEKKGNHAA